MTRPSDVLTSRDPDADERQEILNRYPALYPWRGQPIENLRETVKQNGDKLHTWPGGRDAPPVSPPTKKESAMTNSEAQERSRLAQTAGLTQAEKTAITSASTPIATARFMATPAWLTSAQRAASGPAQPAHAGDPMNRSGQGDALDAAFKIGKYDPNRTHKVESKGAIQRFGV